MNAWDSGPSLWRTKVEMNPVTNRFRYVGLMPARVFLAIVTALVAANSFLTPTHPKTLLGVYPFFCLGMWIFTNWLHGWKTQRWDGQRPT